MTQQETITKFAQDVRGNVELTGDPAETLRIYCKLCDELKRLQDEVDNYKSKAMTVLQKHGTATNNPNVKAGNTQVGVAIRFNNEVVVVTLTETQGTKAVEWQKLAEHLAKLAGVDDVRRLAEQLGLITQRSNTKTVKINNSARARKATGR